MTEHIYESAVRKLIAQHSPDNQKQLQQFSGQLFDNISHGLLQDGHVRIHQFGSFKLNWAKERHGRHPKTGSPLLIQAQPRISFTPAKALKDRVNSSSIADQEKPSLLSSVARDRLTKDDKNPALPSAKPETGLNDKPELPKLDLATVSVDTDMTSPKETSSPPYILNRKTALAASTVVALLAVLILKPASEKENPQYSISNHQAETTIQLSSVAEPAVLQADQHRPPTISDQATSAQSRNTEAEPYAELTPTLDTTSGPAATVMQQTSTQSAQIFFQQRPHKLMVGDSLWRLSRKHYRNPFYWPHIYQANAGRIDNPNKLKTGTQIQLPNMIGTPNHLTAEDRRSIAEGYFLVYRYHKQTNKPFPYYALLGVNKFDPAVIQEHISEIDEQDWHSLQLASN